MFRSLSISKLENLLLLSCGENMKIRIKELRSEFGLSQQDLAEKLNVSQKCVSNWENGVNEPDYQSLRLIANLFDVSTDYLLGIDEAKSENTFLTPLDKSLMSVIKNLPLEKKKALLELLKNI